MFTGLNINYILETIDLNYKLVTCETSFSKKIIRLTI